jgi:hypothetical protein
MASCGCATRDEPCAAPATQEDLLCDNCRDGCVIVFVNDVPAPEHANARLVAKNLSEAFGFKLT